MKNYRIADISLLRASMLFSVCGLFRLGWIGSLKTSSKRFAWRVWSIAVGMLSTLLAFFYFFGCDDYGKPLRKAAYNGDIQTVRTILRNYPDVINSFRDYPEVLSVAANRSSNSGGTLLQVLVARWRSFFTTQFGVWDEAGYSALDFAVIGNQPEVVSILLANRADVTHLNAGHAAALHQAVQRGYLEVVKHFLIHNVDLEIKDLAGTTPLGSAVLCQHKVIAELLITHGANITMAICRLSISRQK